MSIKLEWAECCYGCESAALRKATLRKAEDVKPEDLYRNYYCKKHGIAVHGNEVCPDYS